MQRRALIMGIAGQDGSYLTELLLGKGNYEVHGIVRCEQAARQSLRASCGPINEDNLERLFIHDCGLLNQLATTELVRRIAPDEIYNLAAQSYVGLNYRKFVETDARYLRPCGVELSRGDASKAHARLAWRPATDFHGLVELMVDADVRKTRWEQSQTLVAGADSNRLESGGNSQRRSA